MQHMVHLFNLWANGGEAASAVSLTSAQDDAILQSIEDDRQLIIAYQPQDDGSVTVGYLPKNIFGNNLGDEGFIKLFGKNGEELPFLLAVNPVQQTVWVIQVLANNAWAVEGVLHYTN